MASFQNAQDVYDSIQNHNPWHIKNINTQIKSQLNSDIVKIQSEINYFRKQMQISPAYEKSS